MLEKKNAELKTALMIALESKLSQHAELLIQLQGSCMPLCTIVYQLHICTVTGLDGDHSFINARDGNNKNALRIAIENGCPSDLITKLMDW